jgi:hypothetical protein
MLTGDVVASVAGVEIPTAHGFRVSFLIATAAMVGGLILALVLPRQRPTSRTQAAADG